MRDTRPAPDFYIVGHPKCGTTALYEMLRSHPQVFMPDLKEPWFFAGDMRPRFQPARTGAVPETLADYTRLFEPAAAGQLTGEASSSYLRSHEAAARIAELRPDARIIAIFREPAGFLRSLHGQLLLDHIESEKDLSRAIALEPARREARDVPRRSHLPQMLLYSEYIRYVEQLRRYQVFAPEQVLTLIYDDFRADNEGTLHRVQRFLGIDERPVEVLEANTSSRTMRSQRLDSGLHALSLGTGPVSRTLKTAVKAITTSGLRSSAMRATRRGIIYRSPSGPDEHVMAQLRERFRGEVEALAEYLGRDLVTLWRYERLG
jgi:hypothetical protein